MTIGKKLLTSFGALLGVAVILGVASLYEVSSLSTSLDRAVNTTARKIRLSDDIGLMAERMQTAQRGLVVYTYAKSPAQINNAVQMFNSASENSANLLAQIRTSAATEEGRRAAREMDEARTAWNGVFAEMKQHADAGDTEGATKVGVERGVPAYEVLAKGAKRLVDLQDGILRQEQQEAATETSASRWVTMSLLAICLALGAATLIVVRNSSRALQQAAARLSENAGQVAGASGQVSSASQSLAQGASEQAASLEETSASAEQITSMTRKNADNSRAAADLMAETASVVSTANQSLEQMQTSMQEINASSDKIGKIIKVIDEIAFQTNILALNAAVEAARAGEAGMGFAVVADEVRNLAQRSAQAAKDTAGLIEESIAKSSEGRGKLDQVAEAIRNITASAEKAKTLVDEVKLGSEEQARGIEQISKAIVQMEQVTQKSAANAEEAASAGEEMNSQASAMSETLDTLVALVGAADGGDRPRTAHRGALSTRQAQRVPEQTSDTPRSLQEAVAAPERVEKVTAYAGSVKPHNVIPLDDDFKSF